MRSPLFIMFLFVFCRDDEEDGEWEAPQIDNPNCKAVGCGEWKRPSIKNPNYKGKWTAPLIANPDYKVSVLHLTIYDAS